MECYREGFLNKAGKGLIQTHLHSWRPRFFILDGVTLKYYKSREIVEENMLGCINVSEMESISPVKNEKNAFQITTKAKRTYYMSGRSQDEVQGWLKCLAMAKAKHLEKLKKNPSYEVSALDPGAPAKPPRSPPSSSSTAIPSAYQCVQFPVKDDKADTKPEQDVNKDDGLYADPTYDTVSQKEVPKNEKPNAADAEATDLYDEVETATPKKSPSKKKTGTSDPSSSCAVPPPLPARMPSMSDANDSNQEGENGNGRTETQAESGTIGVYREFTLPDSACSSTSPVFGVYDEVSNPDTNSAGKPDLESQKSNADGATVCSSLYDEIREASVTNSDRGSTTAKEDNTFGLYDEVSPPDAATVSNSGHETSQPEGNGVGLYSDVNDNSMITDWKEKMEKETPFVPDPTHVYAKPQKSTNSLKRERSKKKLIPGLMDVGEVSMDVEEEAAGGKETLKRGMTQPQGDRFAIEELKDILAEYDEKTTKQGEVLDEFDINQCASAFEALRRFLERCE